MPTKPAWERWHLRMTNTPFTPEQTLSLKRTEGCPSDGQGGVPETDNIGVKGEVHEKCTSTYRGTGEGVPLRDTLGEGSVQETEPDHFASDFVARSEGGYWKGNEKPERSGGANATHSLQAVASATALEDDGDTSQIHRTRTTSRRIPTASPAVG